MARTNAAVSVTNSATPILAANTSRVGLAIANNGAATVFLGNASVTTATGLPLTAGAVFTDERPGESGLGYGHGFFDAWFGIVAAGTCDVRVVEE